VDCHPGFFCGVPGQADIHTGCHTVRMATALRKKKTNKKQHPPPGFVGGVGGVGLIVCVGFAVVPGGSRLGCCVRHSGVLVRFRLSFSFAFVVLGVLGVWGNGVGGLGVGV